MNMSLNQSEALQLVTFLVENQSRIEEGVYLGEDGMGKFVTARLRGGEIGESTYLRRRPFKSGRRSAKDSPRQSEHRQMSQREIG